jgi:thioredoxin 1
MLVNENNHDVVICEGVVVLDFWAPWCAPCNALSPLLFEIEKEYMGKAKIGKVNIDEEGGLSAKYDVSAIPSLVFLKDGIIKKTFIGIQNKAVIKEQIDILLESGDA